MTSTESGALEGIQVADFSRVLAGPLCTMILGDLGAEVMKVERPGSGDETRGWGPPFLGDDAAYFMSVNRNTFGRPRPRRSGRRPGSSRGWR